MEDVELVLRFFAFRQIQKWDNSQLKTFLDEFLKFGNLFSKDLLRKYDRLFTETTSLIYQILGEKALWLPRERKGSTNIKWTLVESPTKVAYDTLMYVFSDLIDKKDQLIGQKENIALALEKLYKEQSEMFIGRFNKNDIIRRIETVQQLISEFIKEK
jgi:hypothetical protein